MVIFLELKHIVDSSKTFLVKKKTLIILRRTTFYSPIFKEIGLFNDEFSRICTTNGPRDNCLFFVDCGSNKKTARAVKLFLWCALIVLEQSTFFCFLPKAHMGLGINGLAAARKP